MNKFRKNLKGFQKRKHNRDLRLFKHGVGLTTLNIFKKELGLNKNFPVANISKVQYIKSNFNLFLLQERFLGRETVVNQSVYKLYIKNKWKKSPVSRINKHIISLSQKIRNRRGRRHKKSRPVRGQRTKTNAKTMRNYTTRIGVIYRRFNTFKKYKKKLWKLKKSKN